MSITPLPSMSVSSSPVAVRLKNIIISSIDFSTAPYLRFRIIYAYDFATPSYCANTGQAAVFPMFLPSFYIQLSGRGTHLATNWAAIAAECILTNSSTIIHIVALPMTMNQTRLGSTTMAQTLIEFRF